MSRVHTHRRNDRTPHPKPAVTWCQQLILRGIAAGLTNRQIGEQLHITENTVKTQAQRVFRNLGARDRANAVALGYEAGILRPGIALPIDPTDHPVAA